MTRLLPLLLLALLFAACDSDGSDGPEDLPPVGPGSFHASVRFDGGNRLDLGGIAVASTSPFFIIDSLFVPGDSLATPDSSTSFSIMLSSFDPTQSPEAQTFRTISLTRFDSERPPAGTYPLSDFDRSAFTALFTSFAPSGGGTVVASETGTLTLDVSTEERAAGTFTFEGGYTPLEGGTRRAVTVTGRFDARVMNLIDSLPLP